MASKRILIDCRPAHDYYISHFELAYNLPFDQLSERSYELPPRTVDFDVIINSTLLEPTKEWFLKRHKTPWPVNQFILYDDQDTTATTTTATTAATATTTTTTIVHNVSQHFHPNGLPVFPFSPCPLLSSELSYLQRVLRLPSSSPSSPSTTATASKTTKAPISSAHHLIVDVGCGAGRDVLTLAYAFPQHTIVAIDNLQTAIDRVSSFATRESRTNVLPYKTVLRQSGDLETSVFHALSRNNNGHGSNGSSSAGTTRDTPPSRAEILSKSSSSCSLILVSRFLKREVFLEMVTLLRPGGYLLVHHFLMSCEKPKAPVSGYIVSTFCVYIVPTLLFMILTKTGSSFSFSLRCVLAP